MQQYVIFNVLKEYCIPKEEEELEVTFTHHHAADTTLCDKVC